MYRRELLRGAAALPLLALPLFPPRSAAAGEGAPRARRTEPAPRPRAHLARVRPGDPAWPSPASWQKLNDAVGGNLLKVQPLFDPCRREPDGAACREVLASIRNPFYIGDQPAGTEVSGWLDAWAPGASVYALKARNTADVVAGVNFARDNRLRLVVKGGGHSYQGTSNAPDSLVIWTRAMNRVTLHDAFVARGCAGKAQPVTAVTAEAGAMWIDLYQAVTNEADRYVQGGGCTSVGVAGLIHSGGFGSFSKGFGTAASGLLEAEVVTADGRALIVNACTNPDLLTRVTLRTHALPEFFGGAWGKIKTSSDAAFRRLLAHFFDFYSTHLFNPHWGEQVKIGSDNTLEISMVCQGLDPRQAPQVWAPFFAWVKADPADFSVTDELGARATPARHWWDVEGNPSMIQDKRPGAAPGHGWWQGDQDQVGAYLHGFDSLWLPASSLLTPEAQASLVAALFAGSSHKEIGLHLNKGLAVTEAFALAIIADGEGAAYPGMVRAGVDLDAARRDARAIDRATAELSRVAPGAGSYVSESNFFNRGGSRPIGESTTRGCRRSSENTIRTGSSSCTTASAARTGARMALHDSPRRVPAALTLACVLLGAPAPQAAAPLAHEPARKPLTAAEVLSASTASDWRPLDPQSTLYLELAAGRVVIELAPQFAPHHVANVLTLARGHYFDGLSVMRAQDNYVVQWGDPDAKKPVGAAQRTVGAEFERSLRGLAITKLPDPDTYASEVGFVDGFPVAADPAMGRAWLVHCYGMAGAGRDNDVDSGGGTELYVVIGHAPRHLDRNVTLLGRVVSGMELLSGLPRGSGTLGFYERPEQRTPIRSLRLAADVPAAQRSDLEVLRTDTPTFLAYLDARRSRHEEWFKVPAGRIDVCNVPIPARARASVAPK